MTPAARAQSLPSNPELGTFTSTGSLSFSRWAHTATRLADGKVLIAGGASSAPGGWAYPTALELYDPSTGVFALAGNLGAGRGWGTATLLTNGRVLLVGGRNETAQSVRSAELYDPASGTVVPVGDMLLPRSAHTATLLPSGKVLVTGGSTGPGTQTAAAELFDPATGTFSAAGSMLASRGEHVATLLPDGTVLLAGGGDITINAVLGTVERYDPVTGMFQPAGQLVTPRLRQADALLADGRVLFAGGYCYASLGTAEVFDPATGRSTATGPLEIARDSMANLGVLLPDGRVLIAGGSNFGTPIGTAVLYDRAAGGFVPTGSLVTARLGNTATLLANGQVLIAGGLGVSGTLASAELYHAATPPTITVPPDVVVEATGSAGAQVTFAPTAVDMNGAPVPVDCSPASGTTFPLGTTTVSVTACDSFGLTATRTFQVTVRDTTAPALTLPTELVIEATGPSGAVANFTVAVNDLVDGPVTATCAPASGSVFPLGRTAVSVTATDAAGNAASGAFTIRVVDTTSPVIARIAANPPMLWPPNHKMVPVRLTVRATDAVSVASSVRIVSVACNEPAAHDWRITAPLIVMLRAERNGHRVDRVYTITVEARDDAGNTARAAVNVTVPHRLSPGHHPCD